jgi:hypothetical protein
LAFIAGEKEIKKTWQSNKSLRQILGKKGVKIELLLKRRGKEMRIEIKGAKNLVSSLGIKFAAVNGEPLRVN